MSIFLSYIDIFQKLPNDQVNDIAAALSWLLSRAGEYGMLADQTVLLGYSSGAHLVALLGTDERILVGAGVEPSHVKAAISLDVHAYDVPFALRLMQDSVVERNIPKIRHLFGASEAEQLASSPSAYVDGWSASALIVSVDEGPKEPGSHGYIVSTTGSRYVAALQAAGHQAVHVHDAAETHSSLVAGFGEVGDVTTAAIVAFLETLP